MNHKFIYDNKLYPFDEFLFNEGVFVVWKLREETFKASTPTWHTNMLWGNNDDREFLNLLNFEESVEHYFGVFEGRGKVDYAIIGAEGQILKTNFDARTDIDAYGVIRITAKSKPKFNFFVLPAESISKNGRVFYLNGKNLKELSKATDEAILKKIIKKPKNYKWGKGLKTEFVESNGPSQPASS